MFVTCYLFNSDYYHIQSLEANVNIISKDLDSANRKISDAMRSLVDLDVGMPHPRTLFVDSVDYVPDHSMGSSKGVSLANFRSHQLSSPKHLRYSPKSIQTSLALRQEKLHDRPRSASLILRQSSFGTFEGFSPDAQRDSSINCVFSAPCSPDARLRPDVRLDSNKFSPRTNLSNDSKGNISSPKDLRHSPKSIAFSVQLRKQMLAEFSPYKSRSLYGDFDVGMRSTGLDRKEQLFDEEDDIFHGHLFHPKPVRKRHANIEKVIRTPVARIQHGNRNYYDATSLSWKPITIPV